MHSSSSRISRSPHRPTPPIVYPAIYLIGLSRGLRFYFSFWGIPTPGHTLLRRYPARYQNPLTTHSHPWSMLYLKPSRAKSPTPQQKESLKSKKQRRSQTDRRALASRSANKRFKDFCCCGLSRAFVFFCFFLQCLLLVIIYPKCTPNQNTHYNKSESLL